MVQDKERAVRLQFLEEAQEYLDVIEPSILALGNDALNPQQLDAILRATHSIKGGAGMMGYEVLSDLAHRLEDSFKVLKQRPIAPEHRETSEHLLLAGLDSMTQLVMLHRQDGVIAQEWLTTQVLPTFEQLKSLIGEPTPQDSVALLAEEVDEEEMKTLLFESEVENRLQQLETLLAQPQPIQFLEEFQAAAQELQGLGEMLELPAFSALCQALGEQMRDAPEESFEDQVAIAQETLDKWRQAQALVLTGQGELLAQVMGVELAPMVTAPEEEALAELFPSDLASLAVDLTASTPAVSEETEEAIALSPTWADQAMEAFADPASPPAASQPEVTVRVPLSQLETLNNLFGEQTIERNALALNLNQLKQLVQSLSQRVCNLEQANFQLRSTSDQLIPNVAAANAPPAVIAPLPLSATALMPGDGSGVTATETVVAYQQNFDLLEMDRYSDWHSLSQEMMEAIVQIQEITGDLDISLGETERSAGNLDRTAKSMQTSLTQMRMRPIADLLDRLPRAIRELSRKYDKEVALKTSGANTLIDRTILEALNGPLLQLIRNAFAHGIETPEQRRALGKPEQGTITINTFYRGRQTVIMFQDDGRGIELEKLRDYYLQQGLTAEEVAQIGDRDILEVIFEPGFTTADQVTDLAGRGVGMDVVRANLRDVRGSIQVETQPDVGTTFTLTVPFTLSVLRVLLVECNQVLMAFPANAVDELLLLRTHTIDTQSPQASLDWEGYPVPLFLMEQWVSLPCRPQPYFRETKPLIDEDLVLLISQGNELVGLQVERYWSEQEVTIRQIEGNLPMTRGFSGCTILGNGQVVPLVDTDDLLAWIKQESDPSGKPKMRESALGLVSQFAQSNGKVTVNPATEEDRPPTLLVIDDSINVRRFLALTLEKAGYLVEQAKDGQEAIDKLRDGLGIQLAVCDLEMPRLDGFGFLTQVRLLPQYQELPVMILTSRSGPKHRKLAMDLGATDYFTKPFNEQAFLRTLRQYLQPVSPS